MEDRASGVEYVFIFTYQYSTRREYFVTRWYLFVIGVSEKREWRGRGKKGKEERKEKQEIEYNLITRGVNNRDKKNDSL